MERVCTKEDNAIFFRVGKNEKWVYLRENRYQIHPLFFARNQHARYACALDHRKYKTHKNNNTNCKFNAHDKSVPPPLALLFDFWTAVSFAIWGNSCHVARKLVVVTETSSS